MNNKEVFIRYRGRIVGLIAAAIFSVLFFTVGFGYTVVVFVFLLIGYLIGKWADHDLDIGSYIEALFSRRS